MKELKSLSAEVLLLKQKMKRIGKDSDEYPSVLQEYLAVSGQKRSVRKMTGHRGNRVGT